MPRRMSERLDKLRALAYETERINTELTTLVTTPADPDFFDAHQAAIYVQVALARITHALTRDRGLAR